MQVPFVLAPVFVTVAIVLLGFISFGRGIGGGPAGNAPAAASRGYLELLILFFALPPLTILTHKDDVIFVLLAGLFALLLLGATATRAGWVALPAPSGWLAGGAIVVAIMWIVFAAQILLGF